MRSSGGPLSDTNAPLSGLSSLSSPPSLAPFVSPGRRRAPCEWSGWSGRSQGGIRLSYGVIQEPELGHLSLAVYLLLERPPQALLV